MLLKVGELARRSGLTVRTLHHYDSIGLLKPSGRSDAGYRLYNRDDVARLHQVQALRRFGMTLADIGHFLAKPDTSLPDLIARQIDALRPRGLEQRVADEAPDRVYEARLPFARDCELPRFGLRGDVVDDPERQT